MTFPISTDRRLSNEEELVAAARAKLPVRSHFGRGPLWRNEARDIYIVRQALDCGPICVVPAGIIDGALHIRAARPQELRNRQQRPPCLSRSRPG